jgi:3-oxoacyl-[acyl-carrier-protein] synthase-3
MTREVFITDLSAYLPHDPVENGEIEEVLGLINNVPSRTKAIMLRNNKIERRHYAIDRKSGRLTHTNAQLTAEAVRRLSPREGFATGEIQCLACGTTAADVLMPGHALMVLGELGIPECEAVSTSGICIAGMTAMKYAFLSVASGVTDNAVSTGSELSSSFMRSAFFTPEGTREEDLEQAPWKGFDADFLRWMLSDGAGAAFLSKDPRPGGPSLRIEWIENVSFAGEYETCMYAGGEKLGDGRVIGWREIESLDPAKRGTVMAVRQDTKLLGREIVVTAMHKALAGIVRRRGLSPDEIDWYLPHYSSHYFRERFHKGMEEIGFPIPYERWFSNLSQKGNTGSAAIYIILEELFHSGRLKVGEKLLCFIPESGRFSHCFMLLTVV